MLAALLSKYGLVRREMPSDGDCLFHALALFFSDTDASQMRTLCVQYVAQNPETFATDIGAEYNCSVPIYCQNMNKPHTFGDAIMIQAFCLAFDMKVWLFMPTGVTDLGGGSKNIALIRLGQHYEAAVPR